jgi:hypothetical protein
VPPLAQLTITAFHLIEVIVRVVRHQVERGNRELRQRVIEPDDAATLVAGHRRPESAADHAAR